MKFPKLVIQEAKALKENATEKEIHNLDFETLDSENANRCIYGQMTGICFSQRATELIQKCAERVYKEGPMDGDYVHDGAILNGSPVGMNRFSYFSPIEVFISKAQTTENDEANKKLIQFIKGEIKNL